MKIDEFIEEIKETLELEDVELNEDTNLKDLKEYDSLSVLSIIVMIDENFGKQLSSQQLVDVTTITSLIEKIGKNYFE